MDRCALVLRIMNGAHEAIDRTRYSAELSGLIDAMLLQDPSLRPNVLEISSSRLLREFTKKKFSGNGISTISITAAAGHPHDDLVAYSESPAESSILNTTSGTATDVSSTGSSTLRIIHDSVFDVVEEGSPAASASAGLNNGTGGDDHGIGNASTSAFAETDTGSGLASLAQAIAAMAVEASSSRPADSRDSTGDPRAKKAAASMHAHTRTSFNLDVHGVQDGRERSSGDLVEAVYNANALASSNAYACSRANAHTHGVAHSPSTAGDAAVSNGPSHSLNARSDHSSYRGPRGNGDGSDGDGGGGERWSGGEDDDGGTTMLATTAEQGGRRGEFSSAFLPGFENGWPLNIGTTALMGTLSGRTEVSKRG